MSTLLPCSSCRHSYHAPHVDTPTMLLMSTLSYHVPHVDTLLPYIWFTRFMFCIIICLCGTTYCQCTYGVCLNVCHSSIACVCVCVCVCCWVLETARLKERARQEAEEQEKLARVRKVIEKEKRKQLKEKKKSKRKKR